MTLTKLRNRLNRKQAERVFLAAQRDLLAPQSFSIGLAVAYVLSALVLLLPIAIVALGLWVIAASWINIPAIIIGLMLIGLGYMLFPRAYLNREKTFRREDFPALFELVDQVAKEIGTSPPDGIHLNAHVNAYAADFGRMRQEKILGIGVPLWRMLTPQERVAVLAHEMAHFVNDDPARGRITGFALQTVEEWDYFLSPLQYADDGYREWHEILGEFIQLLMRLPVLLLGWVLLLLQFNRSQRAEYLADGFAARASGAEAMIGSLRKFDLLPLMEKEIDTLYPYRKDQNGRIFDVMAKAINEAHPEDVRLLSQRAAQKMQRVDDSHPPTVYRIAFLEALGDVPACLDAERFDFGKIDAEIAKESDRLGKNLMQKYEETTM